MRKVILLHGVGVFGDMGRWHAPVGIILGPHFMVISLKYPDYRWLGFISVVLDLRVLLISCAFVVFFGSSVKPHLSAWIFAILILAFLAARFRYQATLRKLLKEGFSHVQGSYSRPHVIAHSLGTHFVGTVLRKYPQVRFGKVILAGSVLPADYPWKQVFESNPSAVESVRNDVGRLDLVPRLARLVNRIGLLPGFGSAGWAGFDEQEGLVHSIDSPGKRCEKCPPMERPAPIHNVICKDFTHSGVFGGQRRNFRHDNIFRPYEYPAYMWLPFLWDIAQPEYRSFIQLCLTLGEHDNNGELLKSSIIESKLLDTKWEWTGGKNLGEYVFDLMATHDPKNNERCKGLVPIVVWLICRDFLATVERAKDEGLLPTFNPLASIFKAIRSVLEQPSDSL